MSTSYLCLVFSRLLLQVAQQLCRLLTASSSLADARAVLGSRLERLPLALAALAEVRHVTVGCGGRCLLRCCCSLRSLFLA